jgi:hypothetical protein
VPLIPDVPEVPLIPDVPEVPLIPDVPEVPLIPEVPDVPLIPEVPDVPLAVAPPVTYPTILIVPYEFFCFNISSESYPITHPVDGVATVKNDCVPPKMIVLINKFYFINLYIYFVNRILFLSLCDNIKCKYEGKRKVFRKLFKQ